METAMSQILKIPRLNVPLLPEDASLYCKRSYVEVLQEQFLTIAHAAPYHSQLPKREGEAIVGMERTFVFNGFYWFVLGDLTTRMPLSVVQELFSQMSGHSQVSRGDEISQHADESHVEGYAGHFVPRLWLGMKPVRSFEQRLESNTYNEWHFFTCSFKQHFVRFEERSSILVECKSETEGLQLLNEIAGGTSPLEYSMFRV